ncbi:MAG TPA: 2OG-Fe(II) oxygenase [Caulobacteraceae bacterium]|jgi:hypothetical protein
MRVSPSPEGVFLARDFLAPLTLAKVLAAFDRLATRWTASQALHLVGRGGTQQVNAADLVAQGQLDEIRLALAPAALQWTRRCGFRLPQAPHLQIFPVKMVGSAEAPAYQEAHVDSYAGQPRPPICTNVFYARTRDVVGGELAVAPPGWTEGDDPVVLDPKPNSLASFAGERVHWVKPLYAGERLSVVINFY